MNEQEFLEELRVAFDDLKERFDIIETEEKEREWDEIIEKYPSILVWKRGCEKWIKEKDKRNMRRASTLIGVKERFSIPMVKHHVNEWEVVYVPALIHRKVKHIQGDGKLEGTVG